MKIKTIRRRAAKSTKPIYAHPSKIRVFPRPNLGPGDAAFYDDSRDELLRLGFTLLGDLRDAGAPRGSVTHKTPMRVLVDQKGQIMATIAVVQFPASERVRNALSGLPSDGAIDLETEFSDGRFLVTSNAESASLIDFPRQIDTRFYPAGTKVQTMLREHRRRVRARLAARPKLTIRPVQSVRDYGDSQARQSEIKAKFKNRNGYVTEREVKRIARRGNEAAVALQTMVGDFLGGLFESWQPPKKRSRGKKKPAASCSR